MLEFIILPVIGSEREQCLSNEELSAFFVQFLVLWELFQTALPTALIKSSKIFLVYKLLRQKKSRDSRLTFNGLLANFKVHFHSFFSRIFQFYLQFFRNFTSKRPLWQRIRSDFRQFRKFYVHLTICSCIIISRHARMYPSYTMNYNSY